MILGCIYRHPSSSITQFTDNIMSQILNNITCENKICCLLGDFNINLLNMSTINSVSSFCQLMFSYFFAPHILQPSRITDFSQTLIDNIFLNTIDFKTVSGNFESQISDHLIQFLIIENFSPNTSFNFHTIFRDYRFFNQDEFQNDLLQLNWDFISHSSDVDSCFSYFYDSINFLFDEHAPLKTLSKREKLFKTKPWIDNTIKNEMKLRDNLFRRYCRSKNLDKKRELFLEYKLQRNKVIYRTRQSKNSYYKNYFNKCKSDISRTWQGIKQIISCKNSKSDSKRIILNHEGKTVTDLDNIVNIFNDFFVNIGSKIAEKIPASMKSFDSYLSHVNVLESLYLSPILTVVKFQKL